MKKSSYSRAQRSNYFSGPRSKGFALIVTVTMLILLSLIAVGLLSLSTTTLRSSQASSAQSIARSNARLAAMMAIAQLQELSGPDTRVTASAKLISATNPENSGVWKSWEGNDRDSTGKPITPNYDSKLQAGDRYDYQASQGGRFLGWLNSAQVGQTPNANQVTGVSTTSTGTGIKMVSSGTISNGEQVYVQPSQIFANDGTSNGGYAWWTTGEQTKAYLNFDNPIDASTPAEWQRKLRANQLPDPEVFGITQMEARNATDSILPSRKSVEVLTNGLDLSNNYFDFTTQGRGLMTNVAAGGWRKDLSLLSQSYASFRRGSLPLYTAQPGVDLSFNKITESSRPDNGLMYHWATDLSVTGAGQTWANFPPIASWSGLVDYMNEYQDIRGSQSAGLSSTLQAGSPTGTNSYAYHEAPQRQPQVARIQWILSLGATETTTGTGRNQVTQVTPGLVLTPVVTLWNPFNVELDLGTFIFTFTEVFPLEIQYSIAGTSQTASLKNIVNNRITARLTGGAALGPGATRIYSVNNAQLVENDGNNQISLTEGYTPQGGVIFTNLQVPARTTLNDATTFAIESVQVSADNLEGTSNGQDGVGIRFQVNQQSLAGTQQIIVMSYLKNSLGGTNIFQELYPSISTNFSVTIGEVKDNPRAFTTATVGLRGISPPSPSDDARFQYIRTKGLLQSNPLVQYAEVGMAHDNNGNTGFSNRVIGSGILHTVNAPYEFYFSDLNGWNDDRLDIDFNFSNNMTYIASGSTADDGVNSCVVAEIPTAPLQSLADLQSFDARQGNPLPPYQYNLIGNSSAHPIFPATSPYVRTSSIDGAVNDDAYLLNHVLFDDWFLSSIAPTFRDYSGSQEMGVQELAQKFLTSEEELPNRFYQPAQGLDNDTSDTASELVSNSTDETSGLYPFQYAASLLEVEGMFNINSVSVDAWRAVLMQGRDLQVPYMTSSGSITTQGSQNVPFPRMTIAGSGAAENGGEAAVSGFASFNDATIEAFAQEIVNQVRERGPFLSLSEFVNRQLSQDTNLALAGTIQRALDILARGSSGTNPYQTLQNWPGAQEILTAPPGNNQYQFPAAAYGSTNFGLPGWVRQADVLRPLAPVISARDDTFTIRAYGDSRSSSGQVEAQAWCELVVQRRADMIDERDSNHLSTASQDLTAIANQRFGRRYDLVSFRWLSEDEV